MIDIRLVSSFIVQKGYDIQYSWVFPKKGQIQSDFFHRHVLARGAFLGLVPLSLAARSIDIIIGGCICWKRYHTAFRYLSSSQRLLADPYLNLLRAVNPRALLSTMVPGGPSYVKQFQIEWINTNPSHLVFIKKNLKGVARSCYNSNSPLKRHVVSRLVYPLLAISCIVTRAVEGFIGLVAAIFSLLTAGKFVSLNHFSYRCLSAPGLIEDFSYCTVKFINPWAGTFDHQSQRNSNL